MKDKDTPTKDEIENAKRILNQEIADRGRVLEKKLDVLLGESYSKESKHIKDLNTIFNFLKDKIKYPGTDKNVWGTTDFYKKIETFMTYNLEDDDIYTIIAEVFKSMYVNFLLYYLDDEEERFNIPYLGEMSFRDAYREMRNGKKTKYSKVGFRLNEYLRRDIKKIRRNERISIIEDVLDQTKKEFNNKIH